ncbi:hypothetical protein AB6805_01500 [Chitinophaga sp. RCC_12]|uniref:hypothetical protein n=1 Tax=Chitinophaga sp. RCC_12 TaxID=3239226 RepID=UPI0035245C78
MYNTPAQKIFRTTAAILLAASIHVSAQSVHVKDFHAIPNDGLDDAKGIQDALNYAKTNNIPTILFDSGRYDLLQVSATALNAYTGLKEYAGLHLQGAAAADHTPATWLVKKNPQQNNTILPPHMRFDQCNNLVMENLVFDNDPQYASAGTVVEKDTSHVVVQVFDGLPAVNGMGCYTANIWDSATRMLKQVPSLTFVDEIATQQLYWQLETREQKNYMRMNNAAFASRLAVGDVVSWHFGGQTMFQLAINNCNDLVLRNISMFNIAGFGIHTYACKNITGQQVVFKATGRQLAVGPRDAWKINSCNGLVAIDSMYVEGVRWDGQNVHSSFFQVKERLAYNKIRVWKRYTGVAPFLNDSIGFWNGNNAVSKMPVSWQLEPAGDGGIYGIITLQDSLPDFVQAGTLVTVYEWDIDDYRLSHSTFRNIAGCAGVIKCTKAMLQQVSYDHIMYPALVLGTEITTHNEATFPQDVMIRECSFNASGWVSRIGKTGLVGIGNSGTEAMAIGTIQFDHCSFSNALIGINASGIEVLKITNNHFISVNQSYKVNNSNTGQVIFENNTEQ